MAYGGGTWLTQNKILPGTYVNFSSVSRASATLSDRGIAAAPFALPWGPVDEVRLIEQGDFQKDSFELFGFDYSDNAMLALREIFLHATKVFCYRLRAENAEKAECDYAAAKYVGSRGNDIRIIIASNPDVSDGYIVTTMVGSKTVDEQAVKDWAALKNNNWVDWKTNVKFGTADADDPEGTVYATATAGMALTGGADGEVSSGAHQDFLNAIESYAFNTLCCPVVGDTETNTATVSLYVSFTKRLRDKIGAKFQLVAYRPQNADYEGVIGLWNSAVHTSIENVNKAILTYWLTGAQAGVNVNESLTNTQYDGELTVDVGYKQSELEEAIQKGRFIFHNANGKVVVLEDINTLVTLKENFGDVFQMNQTIRVCDQIANDIAVLFNARYLGIVQNDETGRASLWNDVVYYLTELQRLRAIENLNTEKITCELGRTKKSVLLTIRDLNVINAMSRLYMAVVIQ